MSASVLFARVVEPLLADDSELQAEVATWLAERRDRSAEHDLTVAEYAARHKRHPGTIRRWCREGRITGAYVDADEWRIPPDATPMPLSALEIPGRVRHQRRRVQTAGVEAMLRRARA
jgi:hypothetical protein